MLARYIFKIEFYMDFRMGEAPRVGTLIEELGKAIYEVRQDLDTRFRRRLGAGDGRHAECDSCPSDGYRGRSPFHERLPPIWPREFPQYTIEAVVCETALCPVDWVICGI